MRRIERQLIIFVILVCIGARGEITPALSQGSREYAIKAAFIYNFVKFIEWPSEAFHSAESPFTLCLVGDNPFDEALDSIAGKMVKGRALSIKRAVQSQDATPCHIMFVSFSDLSRVREMIKTLQQTPILTISDFESFTPMGGMINFFTEQNKIRFAINVEAAQRAGLQISSRLLNLAKIVSDKP